MFPIRDAGGNLDVGKWINLYCVMKNWNQKRTNGNSSNIPTGISNNGA